MITAYTGRAAPITRGVQRVRQEIRASQPDPQRSTIAELFAPRFLCERGRLTRFRTGRVFQRRVDRRSRFNKIRSIDLEPVSHRWRLYRIALWRFESVFRGTWTCSWAFSLVWSVVPDPCGFLPRTYRPRWSVFPLFIGQGLRRKYRRRPLGGIMKFQTPIDGREWAREREKGMSARIARYKRFSIVYKLSCVGGASSFFFLFFLLRMLWGLVQNYFRSLFQYFWFALS